MLSITVYHVKSFFYPVFNIMQEPEGTALAKANETKASTQSLRLPHSGHLLAGVKKPIAAEPTAGKNPVSIILTSLPNEAERYQITIEGLVFEVVLEIIAEMPKQAQSLADRIESILFEINESDHLVEYAQARPEEKATETLYFRLAYDIKKWDYRLTVYNYPNIEMIKQDFPSFKADIQSYLLAMHSKALTKKPRGKQRHISDAVQTSSSFQTISTVLKECPNAAASFDEDEKKEKYADKTVITLNTDSAHERYSIIFDKLNHAEMDAILAVFVSANVPFQHLKKMAIANTKVSMGMGSGKTKPILDLEYQAAEDSFCLTGSNFKTVAQLQNYFPNYKAIIAERLSKTTAAETNTPSSDHVTNPQPNNFAYGGLR